MVRSQTRRFLTIVLVMVALAVPLVVVALAVLVVMLIVKQLQWQM
jgi:hypothetical protein